MTPSGLSRAALHSRSTHQEARTPVADLTAGRLTTLRQRKLATHTGKTAHPQLQAGNIAAHHAPLCMPVQRLVLAPFLLRTHRSIEASRRRRFSRPGLQARVSIVVQLLPMQASSVVAGSTVNWPADWPTSFPLLPEGHSPQEESYG